MLNLRTLNYAANGLLTHHTVLTNLKVFRKELPVLLERTTGGQVASHKYLIPYLLNRYHTYTLKYDCLCFYKIGAKVCGAPPTR